MGVAAKIDTWLNERKKTRPWMSIQLGFSSSYIDGLLNGHFGPSVERARKIINFAFEDAREEEKNKLIIELMEIEKKEKKD